MSESQKYMWEEIMWNKFFDMLSGDEEEFYDRYLAGTFIEGDILENLFEDCDGEECVNVDSVVEQLYDKLLEMIDAEKDYSDY